MTEHVRRHLLPLQRRAVPFGSSLVAGDQPLDGISAQRPAATAGECWGRRIVRALAQPLRHDLDRLLAKRGAALFPALPLTAYVRPGAQDDVVAPQADELG